MTEKQYKAALKTLGSRIKAIRKKKNLKQLDIDVISGIDRGDISKIENGLKNLEYLTILKIAEALDVEVYELFKPAKN